MENQNITICPNCKHVIHPEPEKPKDGEEFVTVGSRRIWYDDEVERTKLMTVDIEHSQKNGITVKDFEKELKMLEELSPDSNVICPMKEEELIRSIKNKNSIFDSRKEIREFINCVDNTIRNFQDK